MVKGQFCATMLHGPGCVLQAVSGANMARSYVRHRGGGYDRDRSHRETGIPNCSESGSICSKDIPEDVHCIYNCIKQHERPHTQQSESHTLDVDQCPQPRK